MDRMKAGIVAAVVVVVLLGTYAAYAWYGDEDGQIEPDTRWYEGTRSYFEIDSAKQLAGLTYLVNHGTSFQGKVVALTSDIQLRGQWTPIGMGKYDGASHSVYGAAFDGIFNGNGHSISGLRISTGSAGESVGLFGVVDGGIVRDVALIDVRIDAPSSDCVGGIAGILCGGGIISGCNVGEMNDGSAITSDTYTGGVAGRLASKAAVIDCTNFASVSTPDGPGCGGIVGKASYQEEVDGLSIEGCSNIGAVSGHGCVGGILGIGMISMNDCINIGAVSSTSGGSTGGIVGKIVNAATLIYCYNHGDVSSSGSEPDALGVGGIAGQIRYDGELQEFPEGPVVYVTICANLGDISAAGSDAGGLVGTVFNSAFIMGDNLAGEISAGSHAAGIVGSFLTTDDPVPPGIKTSQLVLMDNVSTTTDISAAETDLFICANGNTVQGTPGSQELRPGFIMPSVIIAETIEDIPETVTCETSTVKILIPARTVIEGMAVNFPDSSFTVYQASCNAGMLKMTSTATSSSTAVFKHNISFGILEDADVLVTMDCPVSEGTVPEVILYDVEWWDLEVVGYTSDSVAFRTGMDGEITITLRAPDSEAQA